MSVIISFQYSAYQCAHDAYSFIAPSNDNWFIYAAYKEGTLHSNKRSAARMKKRARERKY